jgi:hypothetical protein
VEPSRDWKAQLEAVQPVGGGEAVQPQQPRSFPATLQQLQLHWSDQPHAGFILDAAALAACCPQPRSVDLRLQAATALASIGSIAQWTALESLALFTPPAAEQANIEQAAIAAASQLPRLHTFKLHELQLSTSSQQWAQLVGMPALRSLKRLSILVVDSAAAASTSLTHLTASLDLQLPAEPLQLS